MSASDTRSNLLRKSLALVRVPGQGNARIYDLKPALGLDEHGNGSPDLPVSCNGKQSRSSGGPGARPALLHGPRPARRGTWACLSDISHRDDGLPWQSLLWQGGRLIEIHGPKGKGGPGGKRGEVQKFTVESRRRLMKRLAMVKSDDLPYFITCTYPDEFIPDPRQWKRDLDNLNKRLRREHPEACGFWKMELKRRMTGVNQGRLAPHFHLLVWGVPESWENDSGQTAFAFSIQAHGNTVNGKRLLQVERWRMEGQEWYLKECRKTIDSETVNWSMQDWECLGRDGNPRYVRKVKCQEIKKTVEVWELDGVNHLDDTLRKYGPGRDWVTIREWVSLAWYEIVGSGNLDHLRAGTRVEKIRSPEGVFFYASKYIAKVDTESIKGIGRFWGIFNRQFIPWGEVVEVKLTSDQAVRLLRVARRYINRPDRKKKYRFRQGQGMTVFCDATWWRERVVPWVCSLGAPGAVEPGQ